MQNYTSKPSASFTPASQGAYNKQTFPAASEMTQAPAPQFSVNPWAPAKVNLESDFPPLTVDKTDPNCKFAAFGQFSDHKPASMFVTKTLSSPSTQDSSFSSSGSQPQRTFTSATSAPASPFKTTVSEFVPSVNLSAPAFVPTMPFAPTF